MDLSRRGREDGDLAKLFSTFFYECRVFTMYKRDASVKLLQCYTDRLLARVTVLTKKKDSTRKHKIKKF